MLHGQYGYINNYQHPGDRWHGEHCRAYRIPIRMGGFRISDGRGRYMIGRGSHPDQGGVKAYQVGDKHDRGRADSRILGEVTFRGRDTIDFSRGAVTISGSAGGSIGEGASSPTCPPWIRLCNMCRHICTS